MQVQQLAAQTHGDITGVGGQVEATFFTDQLAHRGDDGGGTAGEHLGDLAGGDAFTPLVDADRALFRRQAQIGRHGQDGVTGDTFQNGAGQARRDQTAVLEDEEQVHAAQFLDPLVLGGVQEHDLVTAIGGGFALRGQ